MFDPFFWIWIGTLIGIPLALIGLAADGELHL